MPDKIQRARQFIHGLFQELVASEEPWSETILIRDGHYCGHKFSQGDIHAIWFHEEDEVKVFDRQQLVRVEHLTDSSLRRAA